MVGIMPNRRGRFIDMMRRLLDLEVRVRRLSCSKSILRCMRIFTLTKASQ